jgi:hypothetical protein
MLERRVSRERAGEPLIVGAEMSYHRIGESPEDMGWLASRKLTRQDIAMMMRVPLPMVSIYDDATLANIDSARRIFWIDRIVPFLKVMEEVINLTITPEYGDPNNIYVEFDESKIKVLKENDFELAKVANILVRIGWAPRAVNRHLQMGYPDEDIIDGYLVQNISSIGTAAGTREMTSSAEPPQRVKALSSEETMILAVYGAKFLELILAEEKDVLLNVVVEGIHDGLTG